MQKLNYKLCISKLSPMQYLQRKGSNWDLFANQYLFQDVCMICLLSPLTAIILNGDLFHKNKS